MGLQGRVMVEALTVVDFQSVRTVVTGQGIQSVGNVLLELEQLLHDLLQQERHSSYHHDQAVGI